MDRLPPFDKIGASPVPDFQNADPTNSVKGSIVNAEVFNQLQHEMVNAITSSGQLPDTGDLLQLWKAIRAGAKTVVYASPQTATLVPYSTAGTYTWVVPTGVTWVFVRLVGGGGGAAGGNGSGITYSGGGGGSGGYSEGWVQVTPGQSIPIIVGAPGAAAGNSNGAQGGTGGTSSFGSYMSATGGGGGRIGSANAAGGAAGQGSGGQINFYGSVGGDGNPGNALIQGGQGAASAFGGGGRTSTDGVGSAGLAKGSGAGGIWGQGAASQNGNPGASGAVYLYPMGASS